MYIIVHVKPHRFFRRSGNDLLYNLKVDFPRAALGTQISVPTLEGDATLKIHPGTQPGEVIKLKGKGMPRLRGYGKGDLLVRIDVTVPKKLSKQQKALLKELSKEFDQNIHQ